MRMSSGSFALWVVFVVLCRMLSLDGVGGLEALTLLTTFGCILLMFNLYLIRTLLRARVLVCAVDMKSWRSGVRQHFAFTIMPSLSLCVSVRKVPGPCLTLCGAVLMMACMLRLRVLSRLLRMVLCLLNWQPVGRVFGP